MRNGRKPSKRTRAKGTPVRPSETKLSQATMQLIRTCPECGQRGPHLIPAGFGTPAVWMCSKRPVTVPREVWAAGEAR